MRLSDEVSRFVDNHCHRVFYPRLATRYFMGRQSGRVRVDDLLSITSVSISYDYGDTYTALAATDYFTSVEGDRNSLKSWTHITLDPRGAYTYWPALHNAIKVVGVWAYTEDRDTAWEDSTDEVEANPLTNSATSCAVNDDDGLDETGVAPRFQAGRLLRIESEFVECTAAATNALTLVRGRNGSTAAQHAQNTQIDTWRPPAPVKQAVIIQLARGFERAMQGFGDARAVAEISQMIWTRALDPDVVARLAHYVAEPVHG